MPDTPPPPPIGFNPSYYAPYTNPNTNSIPPQYISGVHLSYAPMPALPPQSANEYPLIQPSEQTHSSSSSSSSSSSRTQSPIPTAKTDYSNFDYSHYNSFGYAWQFISQGATFPYESAVRAGRDADGSPIFVGRAFHEGDMIPAKVLPVQGVAYVSFGGEEFCKHEYEILRTGDFVWEFATNGEVPHGAIEAGRTADGEKLFFGRCLYNGTQTPGKVQVSHGCLYFAFDGGEVSVTEYEVLVLK